MENIYKNIRVQLSEKEIVSIAQSYFTHNENHVAIINWQTNQLYINRYMSIDDLNIVNDILHKTLKKIKT